MAFDRIDWGLSDGVELSGLRVEDRDGSDPFVGCGAGTGACVTVEVVVEFGALVLIGAVPGMYEQVDAEESPSEMDVFLPVDSRSVSGWYVTGETH